MPVRYPVASAVSLCLLAALAGNAVVAQSLPDVAVAIRGSDKPWFPIAIGGRTVAGDYSLAEADRSPEQGAFTWDGTTLRTYPSVLHSGGDNQPVSSLTAVNADGVAAGVSSLSQMTSSGGEEVGIALRFAGGKTAVIDKDGPGLSVGGAYAVDPRGDVVGNTATGLGFFLDAKLDASDVSGLTTARLGAATVPGAINAHGDVAGTSTTLRTFGNRFDANPFEPHVFLSRAGALAEPGQDLGRVPNCHGPVVVGLSDDDTVVGTCPGGSASQRATSWQWKGAFSVLPALPGDDATEVSAISPDGIAVGSSSHGDQQTAVLWSGGHVAKISSLADQPPGDVFSVARGMSAEHWIVVDGMHGDQGLSFLVVPQADADAAARVAVIPAAPTPIPIGAPTPAYAYDSVTTGGPAPTAAPLELMHVTAKPLAPLHARFSGASPIDISTPGAHPVVDDGRRFYLVVPTAVEAFDAQGSLIWKHRLAGATALGMTSGTVVVTTPRAIVGLDAASGAVRWSTRVDFANPPSLAAGDGFAGVSGERLQIYEAKTGRHIATTKFGCQLLVEAAGAFGCQQGNVDYSFTTRFVDGATGRDLLSLPGHPDSFSAIGSSLFEFSSDVIAVHPRTKTYDALAFPGPGDVNRRVLFDGTSVVVDDDGIGRRFRLDADPRSQHVTPFPAGDALSFAAGDGFEAYFAAGDGPLTVVSFDSAGTPSAVVYDGVRGDGKVLIAHGFAFAQTAKGIAVVHLKAKRVLGIATCACHVLYGVNVIGRTAILGCTNDVPTPNASRVTAIDLGED